MNTHVPLRRALQVLFSPDLFVSSICPFSPIHPFISFIWLCKSSTAWQIKTVLSKVVYRSCSSLNPLCSIAINITHLVPFLCVLLKLVCCCYSSLPECSWTWWSISKPISEIKLSCHLFHYQSVIPPNYLWRATEPTMRSKFQGEGHEKERKKGGKKWMNEEVGRERERVCKPTVRQRIWVYGNWVNYWWNNKTFKGLMC